MSDPTSDIPKPRPFSKFIEDYPEIVEAYHSLGSAVHKAGPIAQKHRELIKLGISCGAQKEGAVHSHTKKALEAGASSEEIRQVVVLTLPTLGMPSMMAALTWVNDILNNDN